MQAGSWDCIGSVIEQDSEASDDTKNIIGLFLANWEIMTSTEPD
jgi:hypothetical protein